MNWIIFTLLSKALWAGDNIVDKLIVERYLKDSYVLTLFTSVSPLLISIGIILTSKLTLLGFFPTFVIVFAGGIQIIGIFGFYKALSKEEVSRVIPLFQFTPALVLLLSLTFLKDVLSVKQSIGFILIIVGGFLISVKRFEGLFQLREAFWWMILSCFIYAVQAVILKSIYVSYSFWSVTFYLSMGQFIPTLFLLSFSKHSRNRLVKGFSHLPITAWLLLLLGTVFTAGANLTGFWAFRTGNVSLISVLRGFQSVTVFLYTLTLSICFPKILKEDLAGNVLITKSVALILMLCGLYSIA
jgi:uncharacterized membrane protein